MPENIKIHWFENLRSFMVFLVVVTHVAVTYERYSIGSEWWIVVDPSNNNFAGILFLIMNIFVMATIFFISGFFAPLSLKTKTNKEFIIAKFKRLMIPWSIAVLTLIPAYKIIFLYSRNMPHEDWTTYFHWSSMWSQNWLWFLPVLFLFNIVYLIFSKIDTKKIKLGKSIFSALILGLIFSFLMDYFNLHGWTKSIILDFQNERLFIYFLVFLVGAQSYKLNTFESSIRNKKIEMISYSIGWIPVTVYIAGVIYNLVNPDDYLFSKSMDILIIRLSFLLSLTYLIYSMLIGFKNYVNKKDKLWKEINRNSYGVYIIHVIIMGIIAIVLIDIEIPSIIKFFSLTISTFVISNLIICSYKKLKRRLTNYRPIHNNVYKKLPK